MTKEEYAPACELKEGDVVVGYANIPTCVVLSIRFTNFNVVRVDAIDSWGNLWSWDEEPTHKLKVRR